MPRYSFTEIEAHCRKAARGAGYTWGEADELGKAARWLCWHGINGPEYVLDMLEQVDGNCANLRPTQAHLNRGGSAPVCGLSFGCAVADHGGTLGDIAFDIIGPMIAYGVVGNAVQDADLAGLAKRLSLHITDAAPQVDIAPDIWDRLNIFAHRTYVPATAQSREKGAG